MMRLTASVSCQWWLLRVIPALLFGMYNVGYQHFLAVGQEAGFFEKFIYGFLAVLPKIIVSYVVGWESNLWWHNGRMKKFKKASLVSGLLIPDDRSCGMSVVGFWLLLLRSPLSSLRKYSVVQV